MSEPDLRQTVADDIAWLNSQPAEQRAILAHKMWAQIIDIQAQIARARRSGVRELRVDHTLAEIAALLGVGVTRVKQIEAGVERKEMTGA